MKVINSNHNREKQYSKVNFKKTQASTHKNPHYHTKIIENSMTNGIVHIQQHTVKHVTKTTNVLKLTLGNHTIL